MELNFKYRTPNIEYRMSKCFSLRHSIFNIRYSILLSLVLLGTASQAQEFKPLFNGKNLDGWSTFLKTKGKNNDPDTVFSVVNGLLRISGKEFGYMVTDQSYTNFHLVAEFKWGEKKYPPRENRVRDNGILYYVVQDDKVWPRSVEFQVQEGDCGDFWLIDSVTIVIDGVRTASTKNTRAIKKKDNEKPTGEWNKLEIIAQNGKCTHIMNGVVVNEGDDASLRSGKILIQSEGAEIYYRKLDIKTLPTPRPGARAAVPAILPGKGMAQHDFLYTGQWDTRKDSQTVSLVRQGKVVWSYAIPNKDAHNVLSEFSDIHRLSNGNLLYACKTGAEEITPGKKVVWRYECPAGTECHSAQPIGLDKVFLCQNGTPAKVMLINKKTGRIEMEHEVPTSRPDDPKSVHGQFRHIRMTKSGTYLLAHLNMGKVIEYNKDWTPVWSVDAPSAWAAVRLKNGNTLISGNQHGYVREVNTKGDIVWELNKDDLPGFPLYTVHEVNRLASGNTVISNWGGFLRTEDWNKVVQVLEVTPDKKIVWALHQWNNPDLGPSSCIQLLDEKGKDENGDLQR
jgi:hypothetical protein